MTDDLVTTDAASNRPLDSIDAITEAAKEVWANLRRDAESYIENARRLGELITKAKPKAGHGKFGKWCESVFGLKASQCSIYRRLHEAGPDLEKARDWARKIGHRNANTRNLGLLLRLVDEWRAKTGQEPTTKRRRKSRAKVFVVNSANRLNEQQTRIGIQTPLPPQVIDPAHVIIEALVHHRTATGKDLLDSTMEYIVSAVRSGHVQSCDIPQFSAPTPADMHCDAHDDDAQTRESEETSLQRAIRARQFAASQHQSDGQEILPPRENSAGL
jgi:hypothetical protein